jgi:hypothetical protein
MVEQFSGSEVEKFGFEGESVIPEENLTLTILEIIDIFASVSEKCCILSPNF